MGVGHVLRCLALAQAWQDTGGQAQFLARRLPDRLRQRLIDEGFPVQDLPSSQSLESEAAGISQLAARQPIAPIMVLDGYHFDGSYQQRVRSGAAGLLIVDDCGHRGRCPGDWILNQNLHASPALYPSCGTETQLWLGPQYALLRREFLLPTEAKGEPVDPGGTRILLTMGGADPDDATGQVVSIAQAIPSPWSQHCHWRVLVGDAYRAFEPLQARVQGDSRFQILQGVADMAAQYRWADLAICAGGGSNWEMCYFGVPRIVIPIAANQQPNLPWMTEAGLCLASELSARPLAKALETLVLSSDLRARMMVSGRRLVDGRGAQRVVAGLQSALAALREKS